MAVTKKQRALVLLCSVAKAPKKLRDYMYHFAEVSSVLVTNTALWDDYETIIIKRGAQGTKANFLTALQSAANKPGIKVVDVFLQVHGYEERVVFYDGAVDSTRLRDEILALQLPPRRLRLLYNTNCYGDTHNWQEMIQAGFVTTIGSKRVNATGATEFPLFCGLWQYNNKVSDVMNVADNNLARQAQDAAARALGFTDVNSKKVIRGRTDLRISSSI